MLGIAFTWAICLPRVGALQPLRSLSQQPAVLTSGE